jgi:hypothetical protein
LRQKLVLPLALHLRVPLLAHAEEAPVAVRLPAVEVKERARAVHHAVVVAQASSV